MHQGLARVYPRFSGGRYRSAEIQAAAAGATIWDGYVLPEYCRPAVELPDWHPVEAQHCGTIRLDINVRLGVVHFLEILCTRIEGEQLLEQPVIGGQLNHGAPGAVPTDDVAAVEQVGQQRSGLSAGVEWQRGNGRWSSLLRRGSTLAGDG